jgi:sec-independent protein translocase protein TatC
MLSHLIELRRRSLRIIALFLALFIVLFYFNDYLFLFIVSPLLAALPINETLIATQITSPLIIPIKLAFDVAMLITCPFAIVQLWQFIAPGLYKYERNGLKWMAIMSFMLFTVGMLFCFYIVLPFILQFFAASVPAGVRFMPDMAYAINFIIRMLLLFGISFQVPLICLLLVRLALVNVATLSVIRPYVIVAFFIAGMLLTPPDILSQILLAAPLCILYELGIVLAKLFGDKKIYSDLDESDFC